jgi:serine/threonine protein kinase
MTISISRTGGDADAVRRPARAELLVPGAYVADRYQLRRRLVIRPYAQVWAVTDLFAGRDVEITVLVTEDELARRGFAERVRALAGVRDPAVVRVGESGVGTIRVDGESVMAPFVITEPAPGVPLTEVPTGGGQLSVARILDLIGQAARGLDAVHRLGIVHGGIRRSSLFVARYHRLTIVDFPLHFDRGPRLHPVTDPGEAGAYLAPELWRPGQVPSPRGDVYALGVVAYECLAGRRPFGPDEAALVAAAPWGARPPELPESLAADVRWVVATAMQPEPRHRFTSAGQFADALEDLTRLAGPDGNPTVILRRPVLPPGPAPALPPLDSRPQNAGARDGYHQDARARTACTGDGHPADDQPTDRADRHSPDPHSPDPHGQDAHPGNACPQDGVPHSRHTASWLLPWLTGRARRALRRPEPGDLGGGALTVSAIGLVLAIGTLAAHDATEPQRTVNRMVLHLAGGHGGRQGMGAAGSGVGTDSAGAATAELVTVPDLTGRPLATVLPILRDQLHLQVRLQWRPQVGTAPTATVVTQSPKGTKVPRDTVVTLTVYGPPSASQVLASPARTGAPTAVIAPRPVNTTLHPGASRSPSAAPTASTTRTTGPATTATATPAPTSSATTAPTPTATTTAPTAA